MKKLWKRLRQAVQRRRFEADLADEVRIHREMSEDAARRSGATPEQARRESARAFGGVALTLEDSRAVWRFAWLDTLAQDVRYALRGFGKSPGFALTVIGTLALGLGAPGALFTVFNAMFLRPLAVRDPYSLYTVSWQARDYARAPSTWHDFTDLRAQKTAFSDVLAVASGTALVAERTAEVEAVSGNYFAMLGGRACLGRVLVDADDRPGTAVAVASYDEWKHELGADPNSVGRTFALGGQPVTLVGVACPEFGGLSPRAKHYWVSLSLAGAVTGGPDLFGPEQPGLLRVVGRLKPAMEPAAAESALLAYGRQVSSEWRGRKAPDRARLLSAATHTPVTSQAVLSFMPMFVVFGLILLIACANVANMMLARAVTRQREIAVRLSLGAARSRLVRQLLTESLLLACAAAPAALGVAAGGVNVLVVLLPSTGAQALRDAWLYAPDVRVLAFLVGLAALSTLAFGLVPALQATRAGLAGAIRGEVVADRRPARLRSALVVLQVSVCVMLLALAGTLLQSGRRLARTQVGIDPRGIFALEVNAKSRMAVAAQLREDPLVESLSASSGGFISSGSIPLTGGGPPVAAPYNRVPPEYFGVLRLPLLRGRNFSRSEADAEAGVAIVSETAARRLWPGQEAIGQTLRPSGKAEIGPAVVVGVARDVSLRPGMEPALVYFPGSLRSKSEMMLMVRIRGWGPAALSAIKAAAKRAGPGAVGSIFSVEELVKTRLLSFRILLAILGFLGSLALLLTATGIYGVLSFLVSRRKKEFGIRIALGADNADIAGMVLRQSLRQMTGGSAIGVLLSLGLGRVIASGISGVSAFDLTGCALGVGVVAAAAMAAAWVPTWRAVKVDPAITLRCD